MKIAVLISSKIDYFQITRNNIFNNLLNHLDDYDLFCTTWEVSEKELNEFKNLYSPNVLDVERLTFTTKYTIKNNIKYTRLPTAKPNTGFMWYKIHRGITLIKEYAESRNITYDLVIRIRPDFAFKNPLRFADLKEAFYGELIIGPHCTHENFYEKIPHASDNFFISNWKNLEEIYTVYDVFYDYWVKYNCESPEHMFYRFLEEKQIPFKTGNFEFIRLINDRDVVWWSETGEEIYRNISHIENYLK